MRPIRFRELTKEQFNNRSDKGSQKDNRTLYLISDDNTIYLGNSLFNADSIVDAELDKSTGIVTFEFLNGSTFEIDFPSEWTFDERTYYDHDTKELRLVFAWIDEDADIEDPDNYVAVDFQDLAEKILDEVGQLKTDLEEGSVVPLISIQAEEDSLGNTIHTTYVQLTDYNEKVTEIEDELDRLEDVKADITFMEQRIQDLATKHGLEDMEIRKSSEQRYFDNGDEIPFEAFDDVVWAHVMIINNDDGRQRVTTDSFRPTEMEIGRRFRESVQQNPARFYQLEKTNGTLKFDIVNDNGEIQSGHDSIMYVWGFKLKELNKLAIENKDKQRTDTIQFGIINGVLGYKIGEGE